MRWVRSRPSIRVTAETKTVAAVLHKASIKCFISGECKGKSLCIDLSVRLSPMLLTTRTTAQCLCRNSKETR